MDETVEYRLTYKPPARKAKDTETLRCRGICKCQIAYRGKIKMVKSESTLMAAETIMEKLTLIHVEPLAGSHAADTGQH